MSKGYTQELEVLAIAMNHMKKLSLFAESDKTTPSARHRARSSAILLSECLNLLEGFLTQRAKEEEDRGSSRRSAGRSGKSGGMD